MKIRPDAIEKKLFRGEFIFKKGLTSHLACATMDIIWATAQSNLNKGENKVSQISVRPTEKEDPVEFEVDIPEIDDENPQAFIDWARDSLRDEEDPESEGLLILVIAARQAMVVSAQSFARSRYKKFMKGEITEEELRKNVLDWKPSGRRAGKSAIEKGIELFDNMSEDERARFLAQLQQANG